LLQMCYGIVKLSKTLHGLRHRERILRDSLLTRFISMDVLISLVR